MSPITLTRAAFMVPSACYTLRDIVRLAWDGEVECIVRPHVRAFAARHIPEVKPLDAPTLLLNASILPDVRSVEAIHRMALEGKPFISASGQRVAAAFVAGAVTSWADTDHITGQLESLKLPSRTTELRTVDIHFETVKRLEEVFAANLEHRLKSGAFTEAKPGVFAAEGVRLAESAVFRTGSGPVVLEAGAEVGEFSYFEGPVHVGPKSKIVDHASIKGHVEIGAICKIGGEVEASIINPYTNKQHHGFLGHSFVGSWVNLGAGTCNSDLKNTYGEVRLEINGKRVGTGMQFMGCIIGDYTKSAINTSIFTGKVIGISSLLYGYVGKNVPSFCDFAQTFGQIRECPIEQALLIQKRMFARRGVEQTPDDVALMRHIFDMTRSERLLSDEPISL